MTTHNSLLALLIDILDCILPKRGRSALILSIPFYHLVAPSSGSIIKAKGDFIEGIGALIVETLGNIP